MPSNRRTFVKLAGVSCVGSIGGVRGLVGRARAIPAGGDEWPQRDVDTSQITRDEFGIEYQYTTSVGAYLNRIDSYWLDGDDVWLYTYRTSACASNNKKQVGSNGDGTKAEIFDGDHVVEVAELDAQDQVSSIYFGNSDWGLGVTDDTNHDHSWATATVDTIWALVENFDPLVSSVTTADEIVTYWKEASQNGDGFDGIRHEWDRYLRRKTTGHFLRFGVVFPPAEEMSVDYVDVTVMDKIRNVLFENGGDDVPTIDYSMSWGISHAVLSRPSTMTTTERNRYGIEKRLAGEVPSLTNRPDIDPTDTVYVARNPPVQVTPLEPTD